MLVKHLIEVLDKPENIDKEVNILDIETKEALEIEGIDDLSSVINIEIAGRVY